ncbi:MAG: hypothetical protein RI897_4059 [Verrucomicrobiota bacterium]
MHCRSLVCMEHPAGYPLSRAGLLRLVSGTGCSSGWCITRGVGRCDGEWWKWDMGNGIWDIGCGIWDTGYGIWDTGYRMWDIGCGMWDIADGRWEMGDGRWEDLRQGGGAGEDLSEVY